MEPLSLVYYPDKILDFECDPVVVWDREYLFRLSEQLISIMYLHNGVGLAASQAGVNFQMIVVEINPKEAPLVLINPVSVFHTDDAIAEDEGCLSIPGMSRFESRSSFLIPSCSRINNSF